MQLAKKRTGSDRLIIILMLAACLIALPVSAHAASARYDFRLQDLTASVFTRFPGSGSSDVASSGSSSARVTSDASGSDCVNAYGFQFKRNINNLPDPNVYVINARRYCDPVQTNVVKLTKGHKYYFRVMRLQLAPTPNSNAFVRWFD